MNKTIQLVNAWGAYEANYPDGDIAGFCRYYLAHQNEKPVKGALVGGVVPSFNDGLLMKIIGRISKLNMVYANKALEGTEVNQIEEFGMLTYIKQNKNPKKTEVIYASLFELSSGTDMLKRLQKRGLIKEHSDKEDKRSKRVELTAKGEKTVEICYARVTKNARMIMNDLAEDDKSLCIQLLKGAEIKFSRLWAEHKGKTFDDVYDSVVGEEKRRKKT